MKRNVTQGLKWNTADTITSVRLASYAVAAVKYHRFASLHTWLNKLTEAAVFLLPYVFAVSTGVVYIWAVCILAFAASLEELMIHLCQPSYQSDRKSVLP